MINSLSAMEDDARKEIVQGLQTLYDASEGSELPLPHELAAFYGALRIASRGDRPYVVANLVTSLDGVVSLGIPGKGGGKEISGSNLQDRALMGLLRAVADAVVVGAGTLREGRGDPLTAPAIYPPFASAYSTLRSNPGKEDRPLAVIVTASGDLDPTMPLFRSEPVLVVTTSQGAINAGESGLRDVAQVVSVPSEDAISAGAVLEAIRQVRECDIILVEGGPHLLGGFLAEGLIDEQFLTLSPQIVGREESGGRLSLVEGRTFAPDHPVWSTLVAVKRGENHLFLRYRFR
jgi:riboflavin biosynthesis pyrimidine reductase